MRERAYYDKNRWRLLHGLGERQKGLLPSFDEIKEKVDSEEFNKLAYNKLLQGFYRYTNPENPFPKTSKYDFIQAMKNKIARYEQTHNLELMVDVRNYAMLEFTKPQFGDAYYHNEDDTEHAPLKRNNGK